MVGVNDTFGPDNHIVGSNPTYTMNCFGSIAKEYNDFADSNISQGNVVKVLGWYANKSGDSNA